MPFSKIMHDWKAGTLHSGSKKGPIVKNQKQAVAIAMQYPHTKSMSSEGQGGKRGKRRGFASLPSKGTN